jgi:two-component system, NtrC family, sensor histidine kinase PilS
VVHKASSRSSTGLITAAISAILYGLLINLQLYEVIGSANWPWVSPWSGYSAGYLLWNLVVHLTIFLFVALSAGSAGEQIEAVTTSLSLKEIDYRNLAALYTSIVRSIPTGIITTDEEDLVTFVNSAGEDILACTLMHFRGQPLGQVFPIVENREDRDWRGRETYRTIKVVGGEQRHLELKVSDLVNDKGSVRGRLVVFQDVTEVQRMTERAKWSEQQTAFVRIAAGLAHEIRNPLASIRGAAEMLSMAPVGIDNSQRLLSIVIRESDRLNSLLGDFLLTVGTTKPDKMRVMLGRLVEETLALFSEDPRLRQGITLESLISERAEVLGDPARLKQALWNLLTNAADAVQDSGTIRVILELDEHRHQALLKVQDSGPGIPPEIRDRLFEPFATTKEKGTGLGLSLVLSVVQGHGGNITASSSSGAGATFIMRLPLAPLEPGLDPEEVENGGTPSCRR